MKREDSRKKWGRLLLCLAGVLWLGGCTQGTWEIYHPNALELDAGNSIRNNLAQTVVNPQAGRTDAVTVGLDPVAGVNEQEKYDKSFKAEERKTQQMQVSF